jgi:hypothetical protein
LDFAGVYNIPFGAGANIIAVGYDTGGHLFNFTSSGFQTAGSIVDGSAHTIAAVISGGAARLRLDGAQVATGNNNAVGSVSPLEIGTPGNGSAYHGYLWRLLVANGDLGDSVIAKAESWTKGQ